MAKWPPNPAHSPRVGQMALQNGVSPQCFPKRYVLWLLSDLYIYQFTIIRDRCSLVEDIKLHFMTGPSHQIVADIVPLIGREPGLMGDFHCICLGFPTDRNLSIMTWPACIACGLSESCPPWYFHLTCDASKGAVSGVSGGVSGIDRLKEGHSLWMNERLSWGVEF